MWKMSSLKERGKIAFRANYWYCVLASFIYTLFVNGGIFGFGKHNDITMQSSGYGYGYLVSPLVILKLFWHLLFSTLLIFFAIALLVILIKSCFFDFIEIGVFNFYIKNRTGNADIKDVLSGFSRGYYWKNTKILFERNLIIFLWGLLFVIPGIIKALELSMVPYLLAEKPYLTKNEVFQMSREMTDGNKWNILLFGISFFFWILLSAITGGIAHIFWVGPYMNASHVELYKQLQSDFSFRKG